jgi:hypothetical protein
MIQRVEVDENDTGGGGGVTCPTGFYYDETWQACLPIFDGNDDDDNAFSFRRMTSGYLSGTGYSETLENIVSNQPIGVFGTTTIYNQGVYQAYDSVLFAWNFNCTHYDDEYNSANYPGDATYNPYTLRAAGDISFSDWLSTPTGDSDRKRMVDPTSPGGGGNALWDPSAPHHMAEFVSSVLFDTTLYPEANLDNDDDLQVIDDNYVSLF